MDKDWLLIAGIAVMVLFIIQAKKTRYPRNLKKKTQRF